MAESLPRKLIKFGNSSYIVSLPKGWIDKHKLKKGNLLYFSENADSELTITHREKKKAEDEEKTITLDVSGRNFDDLRREMTSSYINNVKNFILTGEGIRNNGEQIKGIFKTLMGLEILEQNDERIVIKDFLDIGTVSPKKIMKRIDNSVKSMFEDIREGIEAKGTLKQDVFNEILSMDSEINKLHFLILKISKIGLRDPETLKTFDMDHGKISAMHSTSLHLEYIGDDIKRVARFLTRAKMNEKQQKQFVALFSIIEKSFFDAMNAYHNEDAKLAREVLDKKKSVLKECDRLFEMGTNNSAIGSIVERSKTLYAGVYDIAKTVLY